MVDFRVDGDLFQGVDAAEADVEGVGAELADGGGVAVGELRGELSGVGKVGGPADFGEGRTAARPASPARSPNRVCAVAAALASPPACG
jgi:hypothetical protein